MTKPVVIPRRKCWAICPRCGKSAVLYDDLAECGGVYLKCKWCRREFELVIQDGKQITGRRES